ncbi:MAG: hypothetical protein UZ21_OP11001000775 [Microgenomates bacterium OLB22]|nr:MAG: hypothetical protein UZ21_OP11001000775 [Microgenomates bacterium OLB22]
MKTEDAGFATIFSFIIGFFILMSVSIAFEPSGRIYNVPISGAPVEFRMRNMEVISLNTGKGPVSTLFGSRKPFRRRDVKTNALLVPNKGDNGQYYLNASISDGSYQLESTALFYVTASAAEEEILGPRLDVQMSQQGADEGFARTVKWFLLPIFLLVQAAIWLSWAADRYSWFTRASSKPSYSSR